MTLVIERSPQKKTKSQASQIFHPQHLRDPNRPKSISLHCILALLLESQNQTRAYRGHPEEKLDSYSNSDFHFHYR